MQRISCVLFDLDNTLLLKRPSLPEKVWELVRSVSPEIPVETVEKAYAASELWVGRQIQKENKTGVRASDEEFLAGVLSAYRRFLPIDGELADRLLPVLHGKYPMEYQATPHAEETLAYLKAKGYFLGIVSNNRPQVRETLSALKLTGYFDSIVISEKVNLYKPDPKILELACRDIGVPRENSIYVGDHPFDVLCAHQAHMPAVWFPPNPFFELPGEIGQPEYVIHGLKELCSVF